MPRSRRIGLVLGVCAVALFSILLVLEPIPERLVGESPGRASVGWPSVVHYDAANDTTFAVFGECNHVPCGDAIALRGNRTTDLADGPWLVEPEHGTSFMRERMNAIPNAPSSPYDGSRAGEYVYSPAAELHPLWPLYAGYVGSVAVALGGGALAAGARWDSLVPPVGAVALAALAAKAGLLAFFLVLVTAPAALVVAALTVRRERGLSAAMVGLFVACVVTFWLSTRFIPVGGGEI